MRKTPVEPNGRRIGHKMRFEADFFPCNDCFIQYFRDNFFCLKNRENSVMRSIRGRNLSPFAAGEWEGTHPLQYEFIPPQHYR